MAVINLIVTRESAKEIILKLPKFPEATFQQLGSRKKQSGTYIEYGTQEKDSAKVKIWFRNALGAKKVKISLENAEEHVLSRFMVLVEGCRKNAQQ
jgi:hypothetical protein